LCEGKNLYISHTKEVAKQKLKNKKHTSINISKPCLRINFFYSHSGGGVQLGPLGTSATVWPIVFAPGDYDDGEFDGIKIGRGNRCTGRKPTPPLCPSQIPLDQTLARTRAASVGSQRLTAWAMAQPRINFLNKYPNIILHFNYLEFMPQCKYPSHTAIQISRSHTSMRIIQNLTSA
jgi:hypothetical protein